MGRAENSRPLRSGSCLKIVKSCVDYLEQDLVQPAHPATRSAANGLQASILLCNSADIDDRSNREGRRQADPYRDPRDVLDNCGQHHARNRAEDQQDVR